MGDMGGKLVESIEDVCCIYRTQDEITSQCIIIERHTKDGCSS